MVEHDMNIAIIQKAEKYFFITTLDLNKLFLFSIGKIPVELRFRSRITLHFRVSGRSHDKARGGRIAGLFSRQATKSYGMNRFNKMQRSF